MTTVAEIAAEVFEAVRAEIDGVIKDVTLTKSVKTTYNATTGAHSQTTTTATGLAMEATERAIQDNFPAYVAGPTDRPFYLQGLTTAPAENDTITIGSETLTVKRVADIVGAGALYFVVAA